jgi:hypothetical protein
MAMVIGFKINLSNYFSSKLDLRKLMMYTF